MFNPLPTTVPELLAERERLANFIGYRAYMDTAIIGRFAEIDRAIRCAESS
jgi:hypothetical protein